jgi:hypothetical protein
MSTKAGALLWNRMRIDVDIAADIDTGLTQVGKGFAGMSPNEPTLGVEGTVPPADGALPASRVQVIPLAPLSKWADIVHSEPYFNTTTGTVHVRFVSTLEGTITDLNVLFWDPHSMVGPGEADTYNVAP